MGQQWDQGINQKSIWNKWKWTHNNPKSMGHSKDSAEGKVQSNTGLPKKDRNISNKHPNPKSTRIGGTTTKPRAHRGRR